MPATLAAPLKPDPLLTQSPSGHICPLLTEGLSGHIRPPRKSVQQLRPLPDKTPYLTLIHSCVLANHAVYEAAMSNFNYRDIPIGRDDELRGFLEEYEKTGGRMYQNTDKPPTTNSSLPPLRPRYYGRKGINRLRQTRSHRLLTQASLATKTGTTKRTIGRIENQLLEPSVYLAIALAQALETNVEDIFHLPHLTPVPPSRY